MLIRWILVKIFFTFLIESHHVRYIHTYRIVLYLCLDIVFICALDIAVTTQTMTQTRMSSRRRRAQTCVGKHWQIPCHRLRLFLLKLRARRKIWSRRIFCHCIPNSKTPTQQILTTQACLARLARLRSLHRASLSRLRGPMCLTVWRPDRIRMS